MFHTPRPNPPIDLFGTAAGRTRLETMRANYAAALNRSDATPMEICAAAFDFRQGYFIDGDLEGLKGSASTYHLGDLSGKMFGVVERLDPHCIHYTGVPQSKHARKTLKYLGDLHGSRYYVGVRGLYDALRDCKTTSASLQEFSAAREDFDAQFTTMLQAAHVVNERGENPKAVRQCIHMLITELLALCDWQMLTKEHAHCQLNRRHLENAQTAVDKPQDPKGRKGRKR